MVPALKIVTACWGDKPGMFEPIKALHGQMGLWRRSEAPGGTW